MLPTSRNTSYAAGSQLLSADMNDLQDKVIDLYGGAHAARELVLGVASGQPDLTAPPTRNVNGWESLSSGISTVWFPIVLPVGSIITQIDTWILEANAEQAAVYMTEHNVATGGGGTLESANSGTSAAMAAVTFNSGFVPYTMVAGTELYLQVDLPTTTTPAELVVRGVKVAYYRPAP